VKGVIVGRLPKGEELMNVTSTILGQMQGDQNAWVQNLRETLGSASGQGVDEWETFGKPLLATALGLMRDEDVQKKLGLKGLRKDIQLGTASAKKELVKKVDDSLGGLTETVNTGLGEVANRARQATSYALAAVPPLAPLAPVISLVMGQVLTKAQDAVVEKLKGMIEAKRTELKKSLKELNLPELGATVDVAAGISCKADESGAVTLTIDGIQLIATLAGLSPPAGDGQSPAAEASGEENDS
jgi:hypothetical protein